MKLALALLLLLAPAAAAQGFDPIPQDELQLQDNPFHRGDHAMVLAREVHTDDDRATETHYTRIKVFTEEGRKYGDIEIPYWKDEFRVTDLKARTVHPDGKVIEFKGEPFDQVLVKSRRVRLNAKKFVLPDVRPGSVIEYRYTLRWNPRYLYPTFWNVQGELFVRRARFSIAPVTTSQYNFHAISYLPHGLVPLQLTGLYRLDIENVAPLEKEPFMPPADHYSGRVIFYYSKTGLQDTQGFWMTFAKELVEETEPFMRKGNLQAEAARAAGATPRERLMKLYARVQALRNSSFDEPKPEGETKKAPEPKSAEEVLRRGGGTTGQLTLAFVALARAAGFQAWPVILSSREENVFVKEFQDRRQLDTWAAAVMLDGQRVFLDPATPHCPFGLLSWDKTAAPGLQLQREGSVWVETPVSPPEEAMVRRNGTFAIDANGDLTGTLEVVFTGHEALERYLAIANMDAHGRAEYLEKEVKGWLREAATVKLTSAPPAPSSTEPLRVTFSIQAPGVAVATGTRLLVNSTLLLPARALPAARERKYPVHLPYAFEHRDEVTITLPPDFTLEEMPKNRKHAPTWAHYELTRSADGRAVRVARTYRIAKPIVPVPEYPVLRGFLSGVTLGNEEQLVLKRSAEAATN